MKREPGTTYNSIAIKITDQRDTLLYSKGNEL